MGLRDIGETLPPGFRFYPSDEELVCHYLYKKIANEEALKGTLVEIDLHICEPWQLPEVAKLNTTEWYFFSFRDRKYATGFRTNRATTSGYWKATGKDRVILDPITREIVGMRKTLVFYRNRAPNGLKTGWIMHEFRLENPHMPPKEDWVLCRVFHKSKSENNSNNYYQSQHNMFDHQTTASASTCSPPLPASPPPISSNTSIIAALNPSSTQNNNSPNSALTNYINNNNNNDNNNSMLSSLNPNNQVVLNLLKEGSSSSFSFSDLINSGGAKNDDEFGFLWDMDLEETSCKLGSVEGAGNVSLPHHNHELGDVAFESDVISTGIVFI